MSRFRIVLSLAALLPALPALAGEPAPPPASAAAGKPAAGLSITLFSRCPYPANEVLVTIAPDGKVHLSAHQGFSRPDAYGTATRQKKQLSDKDLKAVAKVVKKSKYQSLPDRVETFPARRHLTDVCSHSIEITDGGKTKRISYDDNNETDDIAALVKGIYKVLDSYEWVEEP